MVTDSLCLWLLIACVSLADMNLRLDQERRSVLQEMAAEREHHQRLVKEHGRLQQRMENLLEERVNKGSRR